jgi:elongator complex protein 6
MSNRTPPLLEPYLALPPESSLILLTSILGASTNWLVLRHIYSYLKGQPTESDVGIVLVSFMRDAAFWKDSASRLVRLPRYP